MRTGSNECLAPNTSRRLLWWQWMDKTLLGRDRYDEQIEPIVTSKASMTSIKWQQRQEQGRQIAVTHFSKDASVLRLCLGREGTTGHLLPENASGPALRSHGIPSQGQSRQVRWAWPCLYLKPSSMHCHLEWPLHRHPTIPPLIFLESAPTSLSPLSRFRSQSNHIRTTLSIFPVQQDSRTRSNNTSPHGSRKHHEAPHVRHGGADRHCVPDARDAGSQSNLRR
jgi:hypothetical protein